MPRSGARNRNQELEGARLRAHRSPRTRTRSIFVQFLNPALSGSEHTLTKMPYSLMRRCMIVRKSGSVHFIALKQSQAPMVSSIAVRVRQACTVSESGPLNSEIGVAQCAPVPVSDSPSWQQFGSQGVASRPANSNCCIKPLAMATPDFSPVRR